MTQVKIIISKINGMVLDQLTITGKDEETVEQLANRIGDTLENGQFEEVE